MSKRELVVPKQFTPNIEDRDYTDTIAELVQKREWRWLNVLAICYLRFHNLHQERQADIAQEITLDELDRLNPEGQKAVENGDTMKGVYNSKGNFSDWDSIIGSVH